MRNRDSHCISQGLPLSAKIDVIETMDWLRKEKQRLVAVFDDASAFHFAKQANGTAHEKQAANRLAYEAYERILEHDKFAYAVIAWLLKIMGMHTFKWGF